MLASTVSPRAAPFDAFSCSRSNAEGIAIVFEAASVLALAISGWDLSSVNV